MPVATIQTTFSVTGGPTLASTRTITAKLGLIIGAGGSLQVVNGTPQTLAFDCPTSSLKAITLKSDKAATVATTNGATPDVFTLAPGVPYVYPAGQANPFAGGDVTALVFTATGSGETATIDGEVLYDGA